MKRTLLLLIAIQMTIVTFGQTEISGTISDAYGVLPNANILNQTTKKGTISNLEGAFVIEANKEDILAISHVGYKTVELNISDLKKKTIRLEIENSLDEVVITAQSIKRVCKRIVCSWSSIGCSAEEIETETETETIVVGSKLKEESTKLYPNPSKTGVFNLKVEQAFNDLKIEVFTLSGQHILKKRVNVYSNQTHIDLSSYPNGMYIINYEIDGEKQMPKKAIIG